MSSKLEEMLTADLIRSLQQMEPVRSNLSRGLSIGVRNQYYPYQVEVIAWRTATKYPSPKEIEIVSNTIRKILSRAEGRSIGVADTIRWGSIAGLVPRLFCFLHWNLSRDFIPPGLKAPLKSRRYGTAQDILAITQSEPVTFRDDWPGERESIR